MNEFKDDPEANELARRLARTDFSADSRVRARLRARLLGRRPPARFPVAAWAVAAAIVLVLPLALRGKHPAATVYPRGELGLPILPGRLPTSGDAEDFVIVRRPTSLEEIFVKLKR